jgi:hypothetical protein
MNGLSRLIRTIIKLGIGNVLYVLWYRFSIVTGLRKRFFPLCHFNVRSDFYEILNPIIRPNNFCDDESSIVEAEGLLEGYLTFYSKHKKFVGNTPDWFLNPFNGLKYQNPQLHWTCLPDFDPNFGDIKNIWEISRFSWLIPLALAYTKTGKKAYLSCMNSWLNDWNTKNPVNIGPNWKCGQEASIRVVNLMNASLILGTYQNPSPTILDYIYLHLTRVQANIRYAIAQNNNHGTSEAVALFIGGAWLSGIDPIRYPLAEKYSTRGRKWLENRVSILVAGDGSFSQHSTNYHRLFLDTMIFAEVWRRKLGVKELSSEFYKSVKLAVSWMEYFTDPLSGNALNLGSNDGASLLRVHGCDYRDFRPTIQTSNALFNQIRKYPAGIWDQPLAWLGISLPSVPDKQLKVKNKLFEGGGYVYLKSATSWCIIRYPKFRFRPSHNDIFHIDLWHKGENILIDSGTYSYHQSDKKQIFNLKSVHYHNTVSFDNEEQMPEISRFLLGDWLEADFVSRIRSSEGLQFWEGQYTTNKGYTHHRMVSSKGNNWQVEDKLSGAFSAAIIGFNFTVADYLIEENMIIMPWGKIVIPKNTKFKIINSMASHYYQEIHTILRLEISISTAGLFTTRIELKQ